MTKYLMFAKSQMQINTAYSAWYWAGTASSIMRLMIMFYFWHAVYDGKDTIQNLTLQDMLTYIVVAMFIQGYVSGVGNELAHDIRDGNIAIELMRPYDVIFKLIFMDFGGKITHFFRETLPLMVIAFVFIDLSLPGSAEAALLFLISAALGVWIGTFFDLMIGIIAFWTVNVWGLRVLKEGVITFFSGALVPITLFPGWLETLSSYLPFQAMVFTPVSIYTGILEGSDAYIALLIQLGWCLGMFLIMKLIWSQAIKKVTIFGG
ncbi:ABC-2 family transporter protein [Metabacillus indicus]|uniref:ABC transporter permease n=1 Tax=Metabacillus indicus TaxID=246786 RepID=UPI002A00BAFF|nr:ABC-2 family transporter protein [Metabacillus indicus]MDX8292244.1 ABC-2 family transporter protein [Metabacillus indicus]